MVRNYIRKRPKYDEEDMKNAIKAVESGDMGYKKAAAVFNVKRETLRDQYRKRYQKKGAGRNTALSADQEQELEECLLIMSRWGFGLTRSETINVVADFAASLNINPFIKPRPSEDWLRGFLKRHPRLTTRLPEQLKVSRAKSSANATVMREWFNLIKCELEDNGLMNRPDLLYNVDETGMPLDPKRLRVICQKNISHLFRVIGGSGRDSITVNGCASADGRMLPPYVVYNAKNLREAWMTNGPEGCRFTCSDKGWMDSNVFIDWFEKLFLKSIPPERPVVLFFDGHKSHVSVPLIKSAIKNRVILLKLPPNSTHTLQPLDVGVYGPLKTTWEKILIAFARKNLGTALTKEVFPSLLKQLWESDCLAPANIKSGFSRCGIMPFNPEAVPASQYQAAEVFDKLAPSSDGQPPTRTEPQPSTSNAPTEPQPSTSTAPSNPHSLPSSVPSMTKTQSRPTSPVLPNSSLSIKDFFMKKISPMLEAKRQQSGKKWTVQRMYGESLTSMEFITKLTEEEAARQQKKGEKRCRPKVSKPTTTSIDKGKRPLRQAGQFKENTGFNCESSSNDMESDEEWVPPRKRRAESGSDSDYHPVGLLEIDRNVFDTVFN